MIPVIGAKRLSDVTDESTSLERQDVSINSWAAFKTASTGEEYRVIEITEDADVSGIISPFDREGLGPWLAYPKLDRWKILVVARLDRLTRSIRDFETLWRWLEAHDKILVSIAENIDFGTPTGRLIGRQLVLFAEYEREMTKTRVKDAVTALRQSGKYPGGQFPFGYVPTKLEPKGWGFEPHPIYGDRILPEVVNRLLAGESLRSLCRWLDRESIPTPRNAVREYNGKPLLDAHWQPQSLTKILTSPAIVGQTATTGGALYDSEGNLNKRTAPQAVRDASGLVITRAEPLIDNDTWEQVKTLLVRNAGRAGPRLNTSPLLRVAFCLFCKSPLYVAKNRTGGKEYRYYLCPKANRDKTACASRRVPADTLEGYVESKLLAKIGDLD